MTFSQGKQLGLTFFVIISHIFLIGVKVIEISKIGEIGASGMSHDGVYANSAVSFYMPTLREHVWRKKSS